MADVIVFDASGLVAYLDGDDAHHAAADTLMTQAVDDELGASPLTLAEVLVAPARQGRLDQVQAVLHELEVNEVPFPPDSAARLARLRVSTGLTMPDCCVLLAAEDLGAAVASFDERLVRSAEGRNLAVLPR
ncbi:MAG TPA: type II toxin-antitoxin system VapC family toxin [Actinomycetales bacterium]|nr:type II toxin-antitoxin system VapC family toxin [Actinomycetales bacterium]